MKPIALAAVAGDVLKRLRIGAGLRQDDLARAARQAGLPWTRSVVVALEAGRRYLTIDEFVRVPRVLNTLGVAEAHFSVQLESAAEGGARMRVGHLTTQQDLGVPWADSLAAITRNERAMRAIGWGWLVDQPALEARRKERLLAAYAGAGGDLEQKVGRRMRLDPLVVALIAEETWRRALTEERDRRVADQAAPKTSRRALQALRGHVTRALLEELTPRLSEARQRLHRKRGAR